MAVVLETTIKRFRGLSTDTKPVPTTNNTIPIGSGFTETDTGARYVWRGSTPWVRQEQTIETLLGELIEVNYQMLATVTATHRGHEEHLWEEDVPVETEF